MRRRGVDVGLCYAGRVYEGGGGEVRSVLGVRAAGDAGCKVWVGGSGGSSLYNKNNNYYSGYY